MMKNKISYISMVKTGTILGLLVSLCSCTADVENPKELSVPEKASRIEKTEVVKKEEKKIRPLATYHLDSIGSKEEIDSFRTRYNKKQQEIIYALNRRDPNRLKVGDKIIIPDSVQTDLLAYAPFPEELDILENMPKSVLISRRIQGVALYEKGKLVKWGPTSTGKKSTQTPTGLFYGNYKAKRKISTIDQSWIMPYYFNFMNFEGIGTHEYALPGYPASHGCVRLRREEAVYIYHWAQQWELNDSQQVIVENGTPFLVFGNYDFESPLPWLNQANDPKANFLTSEEMETIRSYAQNYEENAKNFEQNKTPEGELNLNAGSSLKTIQ